MNWRLEKAKKRLSQNLSSEFILIPDEEEGEDEEIEEDDEEIVYHVLLRREDRRPPQIPLPKLPDSGPEESHSNTFDDIRDTMSIVNSIMSSTEQETLRSVTRHWHLVQQIGENHSTISRSGSLRTRNSNTSQSSSQDLRSSTSSLGNPPKEVRLALKRHSGALAALSSSSRK